MKKTVIAIFVLMSFLLPNVNAYDDSYTEQSQSDQVVYLDDNTYANNLTYIEPIIEEVTDWHTSRHDDYIYLDDYTYFVLPPDGFNPLTATDDVLKEHGLPERPSDEENLEFWKSLYANNPTYIEPVIEEVTDWHTSRLNDGLKQSEGNNHDRAMMNGTKPHWSGVVITGNMYGAHGVITIPTVSVDYDILKPARCAGWVGIGGSNSTDSLAQLGFVGIVDDTVATPYQVWYETIGTNVGYSPHTITNFSISPGDELYVAVWFDYSTINACWCIHYYYHNQTQNTYTNVTVNVTTYTNLTSSSEWIMERVGTNNVNNFFLNLAKPTTSSNTIMQFSNCKYKTQNSNTWTTASGGTVYNMQNASSLLAIGHSFSNGAMYVTWNGYF